MCFFCGDISDCDAIDSVNKALKKLGLKVGGVVVIWLLLISFEIYRFGNTDERISVDCIIVLGAAVSGDAPSPVFQARIDHAISLRNDGLSEKIIFTGGVGDQEKYAESEAAKMYAIKSGVSEDDIFIEKSSKTTYQNLKEAQKVMSREGLETAIVVSDPLHLKRAAMMANRLNLSVVASPAENSKFQSLKTKLPFLIREVYFIHHFYLLNQ